MAFLDIQGVRKLYPTGQGDPFVAVDGIDLGIEKGEFISLVGPSGCGKSTPLHMIGGFVPCSDGAIRVDGNQVQQPGPDRGIVFQQVQALAANEIVAYYADYLRGLKAVLDPKNREKVLKVMAEAASVPQSRFENGALLEGKDYYHSPDGKINLKALQSNINSLKQLGLLKETLDAAPHVDNSLLEEAAKQL